MQNNLEIHFLKVVYKLQHALILYTWMFGVHTKYLHLMVIVFFSLLWMINMGIPAKDEVECACDYLTIHCVC